MTSIEALESFIIANEGLFFKKNKQSNKSSYQTPQKPSKDDTVRKFKTRYGVDLAELGEAKFSNKSEVINSMRKDVSAWVIKIKSSAYCRQLVNTACDDIKKKIDGEDTSTDVDLLYDVLVYDFELSKNQITPTVILKYIKVHEGVNGWNSSIAITSDDTPQEVNIFLGFICEDVSKMLKIVYSKYIDGAGFGDGDEGHVYYNLK